VPEIPTHPAARWPDALLVGFASSMRTSAGPAALAARGRIGGRARVATLVASAGELVLDKTSGAADRIALPAVGGRVAAGAYCGHAVAGRAGLAGGAAAALAGSFATWRARKLVVDATRLADPVVAVAEDLVALTTAAIATRPDPPAPSSDDDGPDRAPRAPLLGSAAAGLAAGLAGTAAMTVAQGAEYAVTATKPSRAPATVADRIKRRIGKGRLKRRHRAAANQGMHWLYGTSWGVPLGILAGATDVRPEVAGPAFGLAVWAAALAHQPALGIADVPWKRSAKSLGSEALFHLVYGVGAAAALRALRRPARTGDTEKPR
jgi:hypothetical protein